MRWGGWEKLGCGRGSNVCGWLGVELESDGGNIGAKYFQKKGVWRWRGRKDTLLLRDGATCW